MRAAVFIDAEFTSLESPRLLSLALTPLHGPGCYVELDLYSSSGVALTAECGAFAVDTVLPQFGRVPLKVTDHSALGQHVACWLAGLGATEVQVAYDYHADFDLLEAALIAAHAWPALERLLVPAHVGYLWGAQTALDAAEQSWAQTGQSLGLSRHHALADALALKAAYLAVHGEAP